MVNISVPLLEKERREGNYWKKKEGKETIRKERKKESVRINIRRERRKIIREKGKKV